MTLSWWHLLLAWPVASILAGIAWARAWSALNMEDE
jgi:hypothetical protein